MKVQNTITLIISKNYGRPLSFSLPAWRFYVLGVVSVLLLGAMVAFSFLYLLSYPRIRQMEREDRQLRKERDALREQISSTNLGALEAKERAYVARFAKPAPSGGDTPQMEAALASSDDLYQPPIRVDSFTTRVTTRSVEVAFRLVNDSDANNHGGYLYAIFENDDKTPTQYVPSPSVNVNGEGFPQSYKYGIRFTRIRNAVTFRRRVKRTSRDEYFTHVTLFLFSVRGGLMLRERYELEKDLFFKDHPAVRTQQANA